jgi:integrase
VDEELLYSDGGSNWRDATWRSNQDYLQTHIYPLLEYVALKDITKFQVQMLLNRLAADGYSYTVVYHVRDLIKAALAEAVDQDVLEKNVTRETSIPEIEESEKPVLPVEMYSKLLAGLTEIRDQTIFLIGCFCALRPSELFGLTWAVIREMCSSLPTRLGVAGCNGRRSSARIASVGLISVSSPSPKQCAGPSTNGARFARTRTLTLSCSPDCVPGDGWRFHPAAAKIGIPFHPTFQVLRRSFSTHGKQEAHPTDMQAQLGHSDPRTTLNHYTRTLGPEVIQMVNDVTNRILAAGKQSGRGSVQ